MGRCHLLLPLDVEMKLNRAAAAAQQKKRIKTESVGSLSPGDEVDSSSAAPPVSAIRSRRQSSLKNFDSSLSTKSKVSGSRRRSSAVHSTQWVTFQRRVTLILGNS